MEVVPLILPDPQNRNPEQYFPAHRLVAEFSDGSRLLFDGFTYDQARESMEAAQAEHGDITWFDGVTDEHYENGRFYASIPPPPHIPFPLIDATDDEQQSLF